MKIKLEDVQKTLDAYTGERYMEIKQAIGLLKAVGFRESDKNKYNSGYRRNHDEILHFKSHFDDFEIFLAPRKGRISFEETKDVITLTKRYLPLALAARNASVEEGAEPNSHVAPKDVQGLPPQGLGAADSL